jgi:anti-anti-sigma regulatory factor
VRRASSDRSNVTFKTETYRDEHGTTIRLIGRMRAEHLSDLEKQIRESELRIVLDLKELDLIDVEAVRFLGDV